MIVQRNTRDHDEVLYANKMDNMEKMDRFLGTISKTETGRNIKYEQTNHNIDI